MTCAVDLVFFFSFVCSCIESKTTMRSLTVERRGDEYCPQLLRDITSCTDIEHAVFVNTAFSDANLAKIMRALREHANLKHLCFDGQLLRPKSYNLLSQLVLNTNKDFASLYLRCVGLTDLSATELVHLLNAASEKLRRLTFGGSVMKIDARITNALLKAVSNCQQLEYLCFDSVHIGHRSVDMLGYVLSRTPAKELVLADVTVSNPHRLTGFVLTSAGRPALERLVFRQTRTHTTHLHCLQPSLAVLYGLVIVKRCTTVKFEGMEFYEGCLPVFSRCLQDIIVPLERVDFVTCRFKKGVYNVIMPLITGRGRCRRLRLHDNVVGIDEADDDDMKLFTFDETSGLRMLSVSVSGKRACARQFVQELCASMRTNTDILGLSLSLSDFHAPVIVPSFLDVNARLHHLDVQGQWPIGLEHVEDANHVLTHLRCTTRTCPLPLSKFKALECMIISDCDLSELRRCTNVKRIYIHESLHLEDQLSVLATEKIDQLDKLTVCTTDAVTERLRCLIALVLENNEYLEEIRCINEQVDAPQVFT